MPQNKQIIKSEYSQSFKTYKEKAQVEYNENFKFRVARRDKEVSHQPWAWLDVGISEEDEGSELCVSENNVVAQSTDTSDETDSNFDASGALRDNNESTGDDFVARLKERAMRRVQELRNIDSDPHKNQSNAVIGRPHHPIKGDKETFRHRKSSRPRPQTSIEKPIKSHSFTSNTKPFISYGWGTKSLENGCKKTFNINSEIDVHPSAIRALKKLDCKKQQKLEAKADNARPKTADAKATSNRRPCRSASSARSLDAEKKAAVDWLSEYQQQYPTYTNEVYRRCLANLAPRGQFARLDTPRTCRI